MAKRGREINIRERKGKYYYRYNVKDPITGKRKQKESKGFATPAEARREAARIQSEMYTGTYVEEKNLLFVDWVDQWLTMYGATGRVKNSTVDIRRGSLQHAKKEFAGLKLREVTKLQYQSMLDKRKAQGKSRRTVELLHEACRMMFNKAVQLELIKVSPHVGAEIPAYPETVERLESDKELPKYLEKEELAHLFKIAKADETSQGRQWYNALYVLAYTGLRIGELCSLKPSDIDWDEQTISVTKTLYKAGPITAYELNTPKTKSSIRKIDVSAKVLAVLKNQEAWRTEYKMLERKRFWEEEKFIFVNDNRFPGYPAPIEQFGRMMNHSLETAELPDSLSPHSLRHTYTSLMAEAGVELPAIQRLLGHKNDRITNDIYLHVTKARKKAAVEKLDKLMDSLI